MVLVLVTGHPYAVSWALDQCAALIQAFVPGEEGAAAIAGVISGRVNPSGRLPVTLPRSAGGQPYSYPPSVSDTTRRWLSEAKAPPIVIKDGDPVLSPSYHPRQRRQTKPRRVGDRKAPSRTWGRP